MCYTILLLNSEKTMKKLPVFSVFLILVGLIAPGAALGAPGSFDAGALLKSPDGPEVFYLASDGRRYRFPNMETLRTWYPNRQEIIVADKRSDVSRIRDSRVFVTVRPGRTLVKFDDSPKVYAVENGAVLHWLKTGRDAIRTYGLNWQNRLVTLPADNRKHYAIGSDIDERASFARLAVTRLAASVEDELRLRGALQQNRKNSYNSHSASLTSIKNGGNPAALKSIRENLTGNLSPSFSPTIQSYTLTAHHDEDTLLLMPTASDPAAVIRVNDTTIASGEEARIHLDFGDNRLSIVTTVTNKRTEYTIVVRRVEPSTDNFLANIHENLRTNLHPAFDPDEYEYTLDAAYDEESVRLTPDANDRRSTIAVNGATVASGRSITIPLAHGDSDVRFIVHSENGAERVYTVTVHRSRFPRTEDRDLIAIRENVHADLSPAFDPNYTRYWIRADRDENRVILTAVPRSKNARVSINGDPVSSKSILLHDERTEVIIRVEAAPTFFSEYTIIVEKFE